MRVLLLADHCNPEKDSTPYFGFHICRAIARHVDEAVLVTQIRNRDAFGRFGDFGAQVVFLDSEYIARPANQLSGWIRGDRNRAMTFGVALNYPSYLAFEWEAWKKFKAPLRDRAFDVVHRVTPLSPTLPSPMARWSPVPFVLGPVNGGLPWPKGFAAEMRREREWFRLLRALHQLMPYYQSTYRRAAAILAGFRHTAEDLPRAARSRMMDCPDVGFDPDDFPASAPRPARATMTVIFAGRLVPYKCPDVLVEAFAASQVLRDHRLIVIGDGPERQRLEEIVRRNQLQTCVTLTGWLPHGEVMKQMRGADVFAFPSIRELGAGVVVEAMAAGLTCVVPEYGAPGTLIDADRGVTLPLTTKCELIRSYTRALEELASDPRRRVALGLAAQQYVERRHTWDIKARKIVQAYEWVTGSRAEKPDFHAPLS